MWAFPLKCKIVSLFLLLNGGLNPKTLDFYSFPNIVLPFLLDSQLDTCGKTQDMGKQN